jgi:hypothetical protein
LQRLQVRGSPSPTHLALKCGEPARGQILSGRLPQLPRGTSLNKSCPRNQYQFSPV